MLYYKQISGEFIYNNYYLNKLITRQIKNGKKTIAIKSIHQFIINLNKRHNIIKIPLKGFIIYSKITINFNSNIRKKKYIAKIYNNINYINKNNLNFNQKGLKPSKRINNTFNIIKPIMFTTSLLKKNQQIINKTQEYSPSITNNVKKYYNQSIYLFFKYSLQNKTKFNTINNLLITEYFKIINFKSKCIKEKLYYYKILSNNLHLYQFNYNEKNKK